MLKIGTVLMEIPTMLCKCFQDKAEVAWKDGKGTREGKEKEVGETEGAVPEVGETQTFFAHLMHQLPKEERGTVRSVGGGGEQEEGAAPGGRARVLLHIGIISYVFIYSFLFFLFLHICIFSCYLLMFFAFCTYMYYFFFVIYFCFFLHICIISYLFIFGFWVFYIYVLLLICSFVCSFLAELGLCNHPRTFSGCPDGGYSLLAFGLLLGEASLLRAGCGLRHGARV